MTTRVSEIVVDCAEPLALARWWAETLAWERAPGTDIAPHRDTAVGWIVLADPEGNELCVIPPAR